MLYVLSKNGVYRSIPPDLTDRVEPDPRSPSTTGGRPKICIYMETALLMTLAHTPPMLHSPLADLDRHTFNPRLFCFDFQAGSTRSHSAGVIGLDFDRLISKPSIYSFRGPQSPSKAMLITSIWNDLDFFAAGGESTVLLFDLFLSCKSSRHLIYTTGVLEHITVLADDPQNGKHGWRWRDTIV